MGNIEYICDYINNNFFTVEELTDYNYKMFLSRKIVDSMPNVDFTKGQYNFYINDFMNREMILKKSSSYQKFTNVKNYVYLEMIYYKDVDNFNIDQVDNLLLQITKYLISKYSYEDILNGKLDEEIRKILHLKEKECFSSEQQIRIYIDRFLEKFKPYIDKNEEDVIELSKELIDKGYTNEQILNGDCNSLLEMYVVRSSIKKNSVISKDKENKIPLKTKPKLGSLRATALTLVICVAIISGAYESALEEEKAPKLEIEDVIDDYDYPTIISDGSSIFFNTCYNVMDKYSIYEQYGYQYSQIPLFKEYKSIDDVPFHYMDVFMRYTNEVAKDDKTLGSIDKELLQYTCYVKYVYDKLFKAGIYMDDDVKKAVRNYDRQVANYKQILPYDLLDRSDQKALKKMMKIYEKYCESLEIKLKELINQDINMEEKHGK